jgi:sulfur relay protein TusB/DsrH
MILLSEYDVSKFKMMVDIMKKTEDKRAMLLSDAVYFFNSLEMRVFFEAMLEIGVKFTALQIDLEKRGVKISLSRINAVDYDGFVEQLLEKRSGVINL